MFADGRPSFYSHENAPGIIMAVGNTGEYLDFAADAMCTWLSRDGGASWEDVADHAVRFPRLSLSQLSRLPLVADRFLWTLRASKSCFEAILSYCQYSSVCHLSLVHGAWVAHAALLHALRVFITYI